MSKKRYPQLHDGEEFSFNWKTERLKLACCDCCLVHNIDFAVKKDIITFKVFRNKRSTGQLRRYKKNETKTY